MKLFQEMQFRNVQADHRSYCFLAIILSSRTGLGPGDFEWAYNEKSILDRMSNGNMSHGIL